MDMVLGRSPSNASMRVDGAAAPALTAVDLYDDWLALRQDSCSDGKRAIAVGLRCWLEWRHDHSGGRCDPERAKQQVRESLVALRLGVRRATTDAHARVHLQVFGQCCERLLNGIGRVRNFDRPALYPLFELLEILPPGHLVGWLESVLRDQGEARPSASWVAASEDSARAEPELLLAASVSLALSSRSAEEFHEVLGFCLEMWRVLALLAYRSDRSRAHRRALAQVKRAVRNALVEEFAAGKLALGAFAFHRCVSLLAEGLDAHPSRGRLRAAHLLERTASFAAMHHHNTCLAGRSLGPWFADTSFSGIECLRALEQSPWINRERMDSSRFFVRLTGPSGPMHGVFSQEELAVLKTGLCNEGRGESHGSAVADYLSHAREHRAAAGVAQLAVLDFDHRDHFFKLVNSDAQPLACSLAESVVRRVFLDLARHRPALDEVPAFRRFSYDTAAFRQRLEDVHRHQSAQTSILDLALTTDGLRAVHVAFAPFAFVDGCWLSNISSARHDSLVHAMLFRIFADEVGNGHHDRNHAILYRKLLGDLGCVLPGVWQQAFVQDRRISSQAFRTPAFLLAIDLAFDRFEPELLGVNLAIEMTGLDGFYGAMSRNLEQRGIDAAFWRVHMSVDNLATGHARQSAQLIERYLAAIERSLGEQCLQSTWDRIWDGFLAMVCLFRLEMSVLLSAARTPPADLPKETTKGTE